MLQVIDSAIRARRELRINYGGWRRIQPHLRGTTLRRNKAIRAFQVGGPSESMDKPMWRLFRLDRISEIHPTKRNFTPRADYQRDDRGMRTRTVRI